MKKRIALIVIVLITLSACMQKQKSEFTNQAMYKFAHSLDSSGFSEYLKSTLEIQKIFEYKITADVETDEVVSPPKTDAADDPAIWVNKQDPSKSLVLGTNKKGGIHVFDLQGNELQYLKAGCINNIDLRDDFIYQDQNVVLVAATNCTENTIDIFILNKETFVLSEAILKIKSKVDLVYGLCMYRNISKNKIYVIVNGEGAQVEQWEIITEDDVLDAQLVREFKVSSKPEGMVVDDEKELLYIGVEEEGILKLNANPEFDFKQIWVNGSNPYEGSVVSSDIEGIALYNLEEKQYMVASSQGNFSYAVFELGENERFIGSFVILDGEIDGATETDGLEIVTDSLNEMFPNGMLVVQDGYNFKGDSIQRQNFKYISNNKLEKFIKTFEK